MTGLRTTAGLGLALAATLLAGCEADVPPCPGEPVATLQLGQTQLADGTLVAGSSDCSFAAAPSGVTFTAALVRRGDGVALCVAKVLARPKLGTLLDDVLAVASVEPAQRVGSCPCQVDVAEELNGTLLRGAAGEVTGLRGELVERLTLSSAGCTPSPASACAPLSGAGSCRLRVPIGPPP